LEERRGEERRGEERRGEERRGEERRGEYAIAIFGFGSCSELYKRSVAPPRYSIWRMMAGLM
jgi:hypothetical protein